MKKNKKHLKRFTVIFFALLSCLIISYPLVLNPNLFLKRMDNRPLPFDNLKHIEYVKKGSQALKTGESFLQPIISDSKYDLSATYFFSGVFFSHFMPYVLAHNLFFLLSIVFSFLAMYYLLRFYNVYAVVALFASFIFASSNYVVHHFLDGHGNQIQIFWIPLFILSLESFLEKPQVKQSILLGLTVGLFVLSCVQFAIYSFITFVPGLLLIRVTSLKKYKQIFSYIPIAMIAFLVVAGYFIYLKTQTSVLQVHSPRANLQYSVKSISQIINSNSECHIGFICLAIASIVGFFSVLKKNFLCILYLILTILTIAFMFGPFHKLAPYTFLYEYVPFFDKMRTPLRFVMLATTTTTLLMSFGLSYIFHKTRKVIAVPIFFVVALTTYYAQYASSSYFFRSQKPNAIWTIKKDSPRWQKIHPNARKTKKFF